MRDIGLFSWRQGADISTVERFQLNENESRVHFFLGELFMKNSRGIKMNEVAEL